MKIYKYLIIGIFCFISLIACVCFVSDIVDCNIYINNISDNHYIKATKIDNDYYLFLPTYIKDDVYLIKGVEHASIISQEGEATF